MAGKGKIIKNTPKDKKKQINKGYFQNKIQQNGVNFISYMTAADIQRDANRIFNDFIYNSIDLDTHYVYFQNPTFVANLAQVAQINSQYHYMTYIGLYQYLNNNCNGLDQNSVTMYTNVMYNEQKLYELYTVFMQHMNNILNGFDPREVLFNLSTSVQQKYFKNISTTNNTFIINPPPSPRKNHNRDGGKPNYRKIGGN